MFTVLFVLLWLGFDQFCLYPLGLSSALKAIINVFNILLYFIVYADILMLRLLSLCIVRNNNNEDDQSINDR